MQALHGCHTRPLYVSALLLFVSGSGATAQVVRGTLTRAEDGAPVSAAPVVLRRVGAGIAARGLSDSTGAFTLRLRGKGVYQLQVERFGGWVDAGQELHLLREDTFDLHVRLAREVIRLPALEVVSTTRLRRLEQVGFYERKRTGLGAFVGPERIAARQPSRITDLLIGLGRVRVSYQSSGPGLGDHTVVTVRGGVGSLTGTCQPAVYLDGIQVGEGMFLLNTIPPQSIAAVEIHSPATAPAEYMGNWCGVVLLWSRN